MKILNLSYDDYANFAHENANALRSVGVDCLDLKRVSHTFGYETQSTVSSGAQIMKEIEKADLVQLFHSDSTFLEYCLKHKKRVVVYHTGTTYRQNPELCNKIFNDKVERCFTDQCEFIGLGMKNETYIATAINTDAIQPLTETPSFMFAHYPSNYHVKGTSKIKEMFNDVFLEKYNEFKEYISSKKMRPNKENNFINEFLNISTTKVPHNEQLIRMANCDCYIELFSLQQGEKQYGCFGVTAFEAAALGCIVITNNVRQDVYKNAYGKCALIIANTEEEFKAAISELLHQTPGEILQKREASREWVEQTHSYKATGEYLKKYLNL